MAILSILLGLAWIAAGYGLAIAGVEPVATFFFLVAWAGLIYTVDRAIACIEGRSLIARVGAGGFVALVLWSAANWFLYELANLRLANWHYVFVTDRDGLRVVGTILAFGTVLPGVFWIDHWLLARGWPGAWRGRAVHLGEKALLGLQLLGATWLGLCLLYPGHCFPLLWGVTALLVAPINFRHGVDGLLRQWERGDYGPTARLLVAGAIAGGCWELFNFWARAKWIYTVPFFDELKLFEMPLLGFLGFPPFALECACVYRLLVYYRLAPAFGSYTHRGPTRGVALRTFAIAVAVMVAGLGYLGLDRVTVTSRTPRVADTGALTATQRRALEAGGVTHLTQLVGHGGEARWERIAGLLDDDDSARLRGIVDLYLHAGIGTTYGNRLLAAGIRSLNDMRGATVVELHSRLAAVEAAGPVPSPAQIKVWLRRLPTPRYP